MFIKYKPFGENKEIYEYDRRRLDVPLRSNQLKYVVKDLDYKESKWKPYNFGEYIGNNSLAFIFFLLLSIPFYIFCFTYLTGLYTPEALINLKKFNLEDNLFFFDFMLYLVIPISMVSPIMIYYTYNKNKEKDNIARTANKKILPYFRNKLKEIEHVENHKLENKISLDDYPKYHYSNISDDTASNSLLVGPHSIIAFILSIFFFMPYNLTEKKGEGIFDTIHYMDNKYTIFYKENGLMKQKTFPEYINVNIKINKEESQRTYSYYWVESKWGLPFLQEKIKNNKYYINININKDDYIKGSLLNN